MNKYPSCRYCNQILLPIHKNGVFGSKSDWCPNCGIEINELSNLIKELKNE